MEELANATHFVVLREEWARVKTALTKRDCELRSPGDQVRPCHDYIQLDSDLAQKYLE